MYDVIVVGGGHAGCEASLACARCGNKTLLVTGNIDNVADMPCNPSIGGSAKGIVVREIDALGGEMGRNCDKSLLQLKMLNASKGPAVRALRAQADKVSYPKNMLETMRSCDNLSLLEGMVSDILVSDGKVGGVVLEDGSEIKSLKVILTTGTYLNADIMVGSSRTPSGPHGEERSSYLSSNLARHGFKIKRLKTGTPPRIDRDSIDYSKTRRENGDDREYTFSFDNKVYYDVLNQEPCYLTYTTSDTHDIIRSNLSKSSMYGGLSDIKGVGPRYCPSIEDKVVRFADKERHQLFLEPESLFYDDIYLQGFSTSMPKDVQEKMVHSLPGLEKARIIKYAYAIEYDSVDPRQLYRSLETKLVSGLYTAGQINGSSGYEEAACQGLMAGINASLSLKGKEPLILGRDEAYIGVLIDDLVTKGIRDPYRLLTSRAEYRLLLRHDNADLRLREYGYNVGLVPKSDYDLFLKKKESLDRLFDELSTVRIGSNLNEYLVSIGTKGVEDGISLYDLLKRPEVNIDDLVRFLEGDYSLDVLEEANIMIRYEGYIKKALRSAEKMRSMEGFVIPTDVNYNKMHNLASEARENLKEVRPSTLGQASRISGVNPADISVLMIYLRSGSDE